MEGRLCFFTYHISHGNSGTALENDSCVSFGVLGHHNLDVRHTRALGNTPVKGHNSLVLINSSCVNDNIFDKSHEARLRRTDSKIVAIDNGVSIKIGRSLNDWGIIWVTHNDRAHAKIPDLGDLVSSTREVNLCWLGGQAVLITGTAIAIGVDGILQVPGLVACAIIGDFEVKNVPEHRIFITVISERCNSSC
jgi:hypothetical protein